MARIAAQAVMLHRAVAMPKMTAEEIQAKMDELGMHSTPGGPGVGAAGARRGP